MTLEEKIAVMQACRDGKKIQSFDFTISHNNGWIDTPTVAPAWDWARKYYRVKSPEPVQITLEWWKECRGRVEIIEQDTQNSCVVRMLPDIWTLIKTETVEVKS